MSLVFYGVSTLILVAAVTWILAELATPDGVSVATADLSGLGRTVGLIAAAAVGVPAAVLAYHRQRALDTANQTAASQHEHKVQADNREHHSGRERHLRERYTTCAEQLGHDNSAIRLAGVYALASLADDWHEFGNDSERQVCVDLLCAYLRSRPQSPPGDGPQEVDADEARPSREEQQARTAIIRIIQLRTEDGLWTNCHFDLVEANLSGAVLSGAVLSGANLTGANLTGAKLIGANLLGANLLGANLLGANLTGAKLIGANLTGARLIEANLTRANLRSVDLTYANLTRANVTRANLAYANVTRANLTSVNVTPAQVTHIFYTEPPRHWTAAIPLPPSSKTDLDAIRLPATTRKNAALPDF
ncbi:pentapeptide repeat-containing protein [Rhodococcus coprophilus]|uniref:Pentapeptide repeat-containing protein n=1 Tax=Rhodococcus coprophilus TaxID=38310 RepID=A0A2X4U015_9NOCA|nr:pentapeptide repeat-containing protein [Rhodococcus coprophilus]MBM7460538.1 uncharacterized protein YjbI with pentapeptide repeats [Rhodococcus coprophilus]SQI28348.1 pentapeptide repeat-containing protein [Rhodococcus coprophilus]